MTPGNFVCAALPSVYTHFRHAFTDHPDYLNETQMNSFVKSNVNKYLTTIGKYLEKGKPVEKYIVDRYVDKFLNVFNTSTWLKDCELIIDSGGYQIQQGYVTRNDIPLFVDLYYDHFLSKQYNKFNYAFHLDLAPGAVHCPFTSFDDMRELNIYSYNKAKKLPKEALDKMIYVHHFRTPKIHKIYKELLFEQDMADGIKNFSTGGLVSFARLSGDIPPYIMYVIPLIEILHYCRQKNIKNFRFHVLGGAEWKEILGHKFFERHIKEIFDIDIQITFDSSTFFKAVCMGRFFFRPLPDGTLKRVDFRQSALDDYVDNKESNFSEFRTTREIYFDLMNDAVREHGIKEVDPSTQCIYDDSGSISRLMYAYTICQTLHTFNLVEKKCEQLVDDIYKEYKNQDLFNRKIEEYMIKLNGAGRVNKKNMELKSLAVNNSLHLLDDYKKDPDKIMTYCEEIIDRYMAADECKQLIGDNSIYYEGSGEDTTKEKTKRVLGRNKVDDVFYFD